MRRVWSELLRRYSNRTYYYAPRFAGAVCNPDSLSCRIPAGALRIPEWFGLEERQAYALIELFSAAATLVSFAPPAVTESELNGEYGCRRLTEAAARLRKELQEFDELGIDPSERAVIIGLADQYEWRAEHFRQQLPIVDRDRADANVKGYVDALVCAFIRIFGNYPVEKAR
jgi:predicted RNase H-like nuclease